MHDFNDQEHWAHQKRSDGRRSLAQVLEWVIGKPHDPDAPAQRFQPVGYERRLDRAGYVQFRRWQVYGEPTLAVNETLVWLSEETLKDAYGEEPLAYYTVNVDRKRQLTKVTEPRLAPSGYASPQPRLWAWTPDSDERLLALQVPAKRWRRRCKQGWFS